MYLFICKDYKSKGSTDELVLKALELFSGEEKLELGEQSGEILRTEKGKPYFKEIPVSFSVSHTGDIWVCLMKAGDEPLGVDIQIAKRKYRFERIAKLYYTEAEQKQVTEDEPDEFFRIWTRKEAYAKYTGKGLGAYLTEIDTLDNSEVRFKDIEIREDIKGACCVKKEEELWIRKI